MVDLDAVLLVAEHHRFEDGALLLAQVAVGAGALGGRDMRAQRAEELPRSMRRAAKHQPMPVTNRRMRMAVGPMICDRGL